MPTLNKQTLARTDVEKWVKDRRHLVSYSERVGDARRIIVSKVRGERSSLGERVNNGEPRCKEVLPDGMLRKERVMTKRSFFIWFSSVLVGLPMTALAADIPAKVFENGANNTPLAVSGAKVEVLGGFGFKSLLSSGVSGSDGSSVFAECSAGERCRGEDDQSQLCHPV